MDLNIRVPALEKLLDYAASGIGSVAGHLLAARIARREVEVQRILAEGQAATMQIIAKAQADAREILVPGDGTVQGEIHVGDLLTQRIQFQEEKRQSNIMNVIGQAAHELGDREVQNHEVDNDWTARFFSDVQDVSSQEMQQLWAKILAGEVERPGSTSIKTLSVLKNLDKATAALFRKFCSICVSIKPDGNMFMDARASSLGGNAGTNALEKYGLGFGNLNALNEHGLIISDYNSWHDIQISIGITLEGDMSALIRVPFCLQGRYWVLVPTGQHEFGSEYRLSGVALTRSGQELSGIVGLEPAEEYMVDVMAYFAKNNLQMIEVASWEPHVTSRSNT